MTQAPSPVRIAYVRRPRSPEARVRQTIRTVERMARVQGRHPNFRLWLAGEVLEGVSGNDRRAMAEAVWRWVRDNIAFIPEAAEQWYTPVAVIQLGVGDCEDRSGLVAAMLEAVRIPWRIAVTPGHVHPEALIDGVWTPLETSDPAARFGETPQELVARIGGRIAA